MLFGALLGLPVAMLATRYVGLGKVVKCYKDEIVVLSQGLFFSRATITCPKGQRAFAYRYQCATFRTILVDVVDTPRILKDEEIPDDRWVEATNIYPFDLTKEKLLVVKF